MHINRALKRVRSHIRGSLEKHHGSPTISFIFTSETEECLRILKAEFDSVSGQREPHVIWPKMVLDYMPDGEDGDTPSPIMGPIRDNRGYYLGIKVVPKNVLFRPKRTNVYLEWHEPD